MKASMKSFVLILAAASTAALAADPKPVVGTATIAVENKVGSRQVVSELWFKTAADAEVENFSARPPLRPFAIARNAAPLAGAGKQPLIVVSHGNWGSRFSQGWLATELVAAGYLVLSTTHPGTAGDDQTVAGRYRLWDRSRDVSAALDAVLKTPRWAALIDANRIGFVGHSFGGWTGVSLAGGRFDPQRQRAACETMRPLDFYCDGTLKDDVAAVPAGDAAESFKDARLKAFYIMASGPAQGFSVESLQAISAPFIVDTARFDEVLERQTNSSALARQIRGARELVRPVGHFAYVPECRWLIGRVLASNLCSDPDGVDRAQVHTQVTRDVIEFFDRNLPNRQ
jgi:predicted dienelactone hydrolase